MARQRWRRLLNSLLNRPDKLGPGDLVWIGASTNSFTKHKMLLTVRTDTDTSHHSNPFKVLLVSPWYLKKSCQIPLKKFRHLGNFMFICKYYIITGAFCCRSYRGNSLPFHKMVLTGSSFSLFNKYFKLSWNPQTGYKAYRYCKAGSERRLDQRVVWGFGFKVSVITLWAFFHFLSLFFFHSFIWNYLF